MSGRPPAAAQKRIERKNGAPVPCREWCYQDVLGQPTPARPPKYPEPGCMGHKAKAPCMITRDNKPKWFAHPDEPEWQEVPVGIVAQIQGHKPSATAEKHYTVRPLELLALHHNRIEAWVLEQAGIEFDAKAEPGRLRIVNAA